MQSQSHQPWTPEEDAKIREWWPQHDAISLKEMARRLPGRKIGAVGRRARTLKLPPRPSALVEAKPKSPRQKLLSGKGSSGKALPPGAIPLPPLSSSE